MCHITCLFCIVWYLFDKILMYGPLTSMGWLLRILSSSSAYDFDAKGARPNSASMWTQTILIRLIKNNDWRKLQFVAMKIKLSNLCTTRNPMYSIKNIQHVNIKWRHDFAGSELLHIVCYCITVRHFLNY